MWKYFAELLKGVAFLRIERTRVRSHNSPTPMKFPCFSSDGAGSFTGAGVLFRMALIALASVGSLEAQSITFGSVSPTATNYSGDLGDYQTTLGGVINDFTYPAFNVTVTDGSGGGELLIGQNFLAICVNISYPGLNTGTFNLSTDGSTLSYDIDGDGAVYGDSWAVSRTAKFNAIRDIIAVYGADLVALAGVDDEQFQFRVTALNFALAEIYIDGVASVDPLTTGNVQFRDSLGSDLSGAVLDYFNEYMAVAGTGEGAGYTLYAAGVTGYANQDVILIPVPEPGAAMLAGAAGVLGLMRRRRSA